MSCSAGPTGIHKAGVDDNTALVGLSSIPQQKHEGRAQPIKSPPPVAAFPRVLGMSNRGRYAYRRRETYRTGVPLKVFIPVTILEEEKREKGKLKGSRRER